MITPPKHALKQITAAWQAQVRAAADKPWLFALLTRAWERLLRRFARYYQSLLALPRPHKQALKRTLATTLAGTALLLALGQPLPARAATITVDGVTCTLAEAIHSANNDDAAGNDCVDGHGADIIDLQMDVTLTDLLPNITSEITLEGNGYTIDGNGVFRVLYVRSRGNLTLNQVTITGGKTLEYGGGVYNRGTLTVNDSILSGNAAGRGGGIFNDGTVAIYNSTLSGNSAEETYGGGGGLYNGEGTVEVHTSTLSGNSAYNGSGISNFFGTVTVNNSTIRNNAASFGGGIYNWEGMVEVDNSLVIDNSAQYHGGGLYNAFGTMTVNESTVSGNSVTNVGGGISNNDGLLRVNNSTLSGNSTGLFGSGGAINNFVGSVMVNNSTLSENSAGSLYGSGGGIMNDGGVVTLTNSTLTGNSAPSGGGITNGHFVVQKGTLSLNRSLISGNSAGTGAEVYNLGTVHGNNFNVVGYAGEARSIGFIPGVNDIIPAGALDTVLDPTLADNGGPTHTHALVPDSVAIDAAPSAACLALPINGIDQRGFPRNIDGDGLLSDKECDAGAFEYSADIVPTPTPRPTRTPGLPPTPTIAPPAVP